MVGYTDKGEDTKMADNSVDIVSLAFVIHECPEHATRALMTPAARILKPGRERFRDDRQQPQNLR